MKISAVVTVAATAVSPERERSKVPCWTFLTTLSMT
jgi:hypothetical protein